MKKFICLLLVLCVVPIVALSDVDLSSMSYEELVELNKNVIAEILSRPEWKEIVVPSGQWVVGKDIPVGFYSISPTEYGGYLRIKDERGKMLISQGIRKETDAFWKYELKDGYTVEIETGSLIFAPAKSLGF